MKEFIFTFQKGIIEIIGDDYIGLYLHGSLAMGGFNPKKSDIDILVVTNKSIETEKKRNLAQFILDYSNSPYPIEISFLNREQLMDWQHPCPFEFHYSELWRKRYEDDLLGEIYKFINEDIKTDKDLAAHITITNHRGISVEGKPIDEVFPLVPRSDYISSILDDFQDCFENIEAAPVYCSLNMMRVFWYLKQGVISSKQEAGNWALETLPNELRAAMDKVVDSYSNESDNNMFEKDELLLLKNYISDHVQKLLR
ncbi:aminoglycoside adenylyltransferase domain-containing protein [Oceanobacillus sp. FSL H7-0719]|uniref:aminoglycoside adenylyltransferase domain-containing protein n=1 Tax=Oceanobacillus sp. FSL H7-0719 TaxID=2954507 RepID=UPI003251C077